MDPHRNLFSFYVQNLNRFTLQFCLTPCKKCNYYHFRDLDAVIYSNSYKIFWQKRCYILFFLPFQRPSFIPSLTLFILYVDPSFWPISFFFSLKTSFSISYRASLAAINFPQFLFEKVFITLSLSKGNLSGYRMLYLFFFNLNTKIF